MKNRYLDALKTSALSIIPMIAIVLVLHFTNLAKITQGDSLDNIWLILAGMVVLVIGLALFQIGASSSLTKVGEYMGASLSKQKKIFVVILFSFALGLLITCAEPSILIVSKQVTIIPDNPAANAIVLIGGIALGVGIFVVIGVIRITKHQSLKLWYLLFYFITFLIICLIAIDPDRRKLLPFIFDAGGVTTGSATVPFILALGAGIAAVRGGKNATDDSFGLVGMASIGPIMTTAILILIRSNIPAYIPPSYYEGSVFMKFVDAMIFSPTGTGSAIEVLIAIAPILIIFFIYNGLYLHLPKKRIYKLLIGFVYTYVGLTLFLSATNAAMSPIGSIVGGNLSSQNDAVIILICFAIGLVTILCEPAVHVLTKQIAEISDGRIKKSTVVIALSLGVGVAIALAAIKAIFKINVLYIVIPGYIIIMVLMFFTPKIYTAMAFDSGGTASGPMASSFVLPMIIGIVMARDGGTENVYEYGFGVVALIAMTPIIAIQILGLSQSIKTQKALKVMRAHVYSDEDAQIIHF